jgi:FixJ family two-component response regulator
MQGRKRVNHDAIVHVVEDDMAMLDALTLLLQSGGFQVRAFTSAEAFLIEIKPTEPICLLTDLRLPKMDGLALYRHLVSLVTDPAVVMITGHGDIPMAVAALKDGVMDFVEKPFDPGILLNSVCAASQRAATNRRRRAVGTDIESRYRALTAREKEIINLLAEGQSNKAIAATLGISPRTAEHHRAHVMEKLGVRTLSQLIKVALRLPGD